MKEPLNHTQTLAQTALRPASSVMRLERMGSFFPTRLSFMRSLLRKLHEEKAVVDRPIWAINDQGFGHAVYSVALSGHTYSLVAFSNEIPDDKRTDRVIAEMWDTAFVLFDGIPTSADITRLQENAPKQEAGRFLPSDLILSRANKSIRLFAHVVERLAKGEQPDKAMIAKIGYLMRTTAVYGNGKFGIADHAPIAERPGMNHPFRLEMLTVWLIRAFTHDLVEYAAEIKAPGIAAKLAPDIKRHLGIGNSTGLGMAPFLVNHPTLINNWMMVRETALARILAIETTDHHTISELVQLSERVKNHLYEWVVDDQRQMQRIEILRDEFVGISQNIQSDFLRQPYPFAKLLESTLNCSTECQELIVSLLLEPQGHLIDGLCECMDANGEPCLDPAMRVSKLREIITEHWDWALAYNFEDKRQSHHFWYVSEEKLEPRLGNRHEEPGADLESPLDIARQLQKLNQDLASAHPDMSIAEFLMAVPQHRNITRRVQALPKHPYGEIRDNLLAEDCLPIDLLRCKLSFFGASKFDPKSDRWTRITLFQGAPLIDEITTLGDDWWLPAFFEKAAP